MQLYLYRTRSILLQTRLINLYNVIMTPKIAPARLIDIPILVLSLYAALFQANPIHSQPLSVPPEYLQLRKIAIAFFNEKNYDSALHYFNEASASWGGSHFSDDTFTIAEIWGYKNNEDSAFFNLEPLVEGRFYNYPKLEENEAFKDIRNSPRFQSIILKARENQLKYEPKLNFEWARLLENVFREDQKRAKINWSDSAEVAGIVKIDSINLTIVTAFIEKNGWQGKDVVGSTGNVALFLVIQHAPLEYQKKYLPHLRTAVKNKISPPDHLALLEDRIAVEEKRPQIYGTQVEFSEATKTYKLYPVFDEKNINTRRKSVGLNSIEEYLKTFAE